MKSKLSMLFITVMLTACSKLKPVRMCTMEFRTFGVRIADKNKNAVILDTCYTQIISTGKTFHVENFLSSPKEGFYEVFSDGEINLIPENKNISIKFIGIKNNIAIINEPFVVKSNGCHINKISGIDEITVE